MLTHATRKLNTSAAPVILEVYEGRRADRYLVKADDLDRPATGANRRGRLAGIHIGRASDNDISLSAQLVSRHHAVLTRWLNQTVVVDLGSANGTYVDGRRIAAGVPVTVSTGSKISFGQGATLTVTR